MNKIIVLCMAVLGMANVYAFDGVVGETLKGVGYVLFGDNIHNQCHHGSHTTVVVGNSPYVTQLYRSGYNNYYSQPRLVVQVPQQPVQQVVVQQQVVEQYPSATQVTETRSSVYTEYQPEKVSVTQVAQPTRVWVPERYESRTTAEGITIRVKVEGHYVMTY